MSSLENSICKTLDRGQSAMNWTIILILQFPKKSAVRSLTITTTNSYISFQGGGHRTSTWAIHAAIYNGSSSKDSTCPVIRSYMTMWDTAEKLARSRYTIDIVIHNFPTFCQSYARLNNTKLQLSHMYTISANAWSAWLYHVNFEETNKIDSQALLSLL